MTSRLLSRALPAALALMALSGTPAEASCSGTDWARQTPDCWRRQGAPEATTDRRGWDGDASERGKRFVLRQEMRPMPQSGRLCYDFGGGWFSDLPLAGATGGCGDGASFRFRSRF